MLRRLARFSFRHRRLVAAAWALLFLAGIVVGGRVLSRLSSDVGDVAGTEAALAEARLDALQPGGPSIYALADGADPRDRQVAARIRATVERLRALPGVAKVTDPVTTPARDLVAGDGRAALLVVEFAPGLPDERFDPALAAAAAELRRLGTPRVLVGGGPLQDREFEDQVQADLSRAELFSLPVVLVLLLVVFGGIVAAGLPVLVALVGVAGSLLALLGISALTDVSVYSVNVVTMLGLGLAVDYALLLVSRFREERTRDGLPAAVEAAVATAGRTVVFSSLTVAASLTGLLVFPDPFLRSMAYGGGAVVLIDMLAAVTLLPALLGMWGGRIRPARPGSQRRADRGLFASLSRVVQRRATLIVVAGAAPLLLAGIPFLHARYQQPDARFLPAGAESRELFETVQARFPAAVWTEPITVVAETIDEGMLAAFAERIGRLDGVLTVGKPAELPDGVHVLEVVPAGGGRDATASRLVREIRDLTAPFPIQVTGEAARLVDYQAVIVHRLPLAIGLVALATIVLLFAFTGSVVVPLKAIVMNALSLGASFGVLVWVFQDGHLAWLVGADPVGALDPTIPVLTFAITFGLSMDYEVFLLSRIKEAWDETGDNDRAVALGLQRSGRIVTSAALLLAIVFAGFVAGGMLTIKQVGVGTVLAVLLDATVVRMLLVPATMKLVGRWNWWAPPSLRRLHRHVGLREPAAAPDQPAPAMPAAGGRLATEAEKASA
jgi:RND superfamily putative drug exporter